MLADSSRDEYVEGPRFEHFIGKNVELTLLYDIENQRTPGVYIRDSEFAVIVSRFPGDWSGTIHGPLHGTFIERSRIGTFVGEWNGVRSYDVTWTRSRLRNSYLGQLSVA